jgi:F-type H+-transporting ATPase subunit gamma
MKRSLYIERELGQVSTIKDVTAVFEAIASIHISQIKDKVMLSTTFFEELWQIYSQLRLGEQDYARSRKPAVTDRPALVIITSDGGLIGDIDERIVGAVAAHPDAHRADIYSIGAHGTTLLARRGLKATKAFAMPSADDNIKMGPVAAVLNRYASASVYYQRYVSLLKQDIAHIDLFSAVTALGSAGPAGVLERPSEVISQRDYIFEPSLKEVVTYMESIMVEIALGQMVLESKLAQYASRFNTMSSAQGKAKEMERDLRLSYNRARRGQADERIKEVLSGMKAMERVHHD